MPVLTSVDERHQSFWHCGPVLTQMRIAWNAIAQEGGSDKVHTVVRSAPMHDCFEERVCQLFACHRKGIGHLPHIASNLLWNMVPLKRARTKPGVFAAICCESLPSWMLLRDCQHGLDEHFFRCHFWRHEMLQPVPIYQLQLLAQLTHQMLAAAPHSSSRICELSPHHVTLIIMVRVAPQTFTHPFLCVKQSLEKVPVNAVFSRAVPPHLAWYPQWSPRHTHRWKTASLVIS